MNRLKVTGIFLLSLLAVPLTAQAFPIAASGTEGLTVIVSNSDDVIATYQGNSAGYSNDLYLGNTLIFNNHSSPVGSTVNLGSFPPGTELMFRLHVNNTGYDYFTGPAERNPDLHAHARVQQNWQPNEALVSFEDLYDGPFGYNDLSFSFTNVSSTQTDTDNDGVLDPDDNCPDIANPGQEDYDGDGIGDACDNCPETYNPDQDDVENCTCDLNASLQYGQITIDTTPGHGDQDHARFKMTGLTDLGDAAPQGDVELVFTAKTPSGTAYSFSGTGIVEGNRLSLHQVAGNGEEKITCRLSTELCVIFIERDVDIDETVLDANPVTLSLEVNGTKYCHTADWAGEVSPERTVYKPAPYVDVD